mgnify:CR=1 FL=1
MRNRLFWVPFLGLAVAISQAWPIATAQDITGGGSLVRDITGGAALIFRGRSLHEAVSARPGARAYEVDRVGAAKEQEVLEV